MNESGSTRCSGSHSEMIMNTYASHKYHPEYEVLQVSHTLPTGFMRIGNNYHFLFYRLIPDTREFKIHNSISFRFSQSVINQITA